MGKPFLLDQMGQSYRIDLLEALELPQEQAGAIAAEHGLGGGDDGGDGHF